MEFNCNTKRRFKNVKGYEKHKVTLKIEKLGKVDAITGEQIMYSIYVDFSQVLKELEKSHL